MGLGQLQWIALYVFSFVLGFPFLVEFLRVFLLVQPTTRYEKRGDELRQVRYTSGKTWMDHLVVSRRWWEFVQSRVWTAMPLWGYPLAWAAVMSTYVASIFITWNRPGNYDEWEYNYLLALVFPHSLLTLTWIPSFFRMRSHLWAVVSSLTIALTALSGTIIQGVSNIDIEFYLYLPFLVWWCYIAQLSAQVWLDARKNKRDDFVFDDTFDPHDHLGPFDNVSVSQKHGWEYVDDPTLQVVQTGRSVKQLRS